MNEKLLQYIWQFQYFNLNELTSEDGEPVIIINAGKINSNQGPDFLDAKIKIDNTIWIGNIELHVKNSDWNIHQHGNDPNYKNIILHVVWQVDIVLDAPFPVLELQSKVSKLLLKKYQELMQPHGFIPCENMFPDTDDLVWAHWKERLLIERLQHKATTILSCLAENNNHWEETFWWMIAKNFGTKINSEAFEQIARSVSITILAKHKNQIHQIEAMLLGQAGLLTGDFKDDYCKLLQKEYQFLKNKYRLQPIKVQVHYLRMRPSNFPSLRLARLAMLVHNSIHLFSKIISTEKVSSIKKMLEITANDYWHYHYLPDEPSNFLEKKLGIQMQDNIIINTIVPFLFAYGYQLKDTGFTSRAINWLETIAAEKNSICKGFEALGIQQKSAFDTQALIQLKNNYCNKKHCLDCAIGNKILKRSATTSVAI